MHVGEVEGGHVCLSTHAMVPPLLSPLQCGILPQETFVRFRDQLWCANQSRLHKFEGENYLPLIVIIHEQYNIMLI